MPSCKKIEPLLSSYHDDELDAQQRRLVAEHLDTCPHCREQLSAIQAVSRAFGALEPLEVTEKFQDSLHLALVNAARVHRMQPEQKRAPWYYRIPRWLRDWRTYSAAAACLVIAAVFGSGVFQDYSVPTPAAPVATSAAPSPNPQPGAALQMQEPSPQPEGDGIAASAVPRVTATAEQPRPDRTQSAAQAVPPAASGAGKKEPKQAGATAKPAEQPQPQADIGAAVTPQPTELPNQPNLQLPGDGLNEIQPTPTPGNGGGAGGNEAPRASAYGIGRTTLYFRAADQAALETVAEIACEYGEVTVSDTRVAIKVPNENYGPLVSALYTAQTISQTGSMHEPVSESDPAVNEATDFVYIVVTL